jgi:cytidylate kinase
MVRPLAAVAAEPADLRMRFQLLLDRAASATETQEAPVPGPYLTLSREAGSGGAEIACRIGERLGWSVLDRNLVNTLAQRLELEPRLLELMDETRVGWFSETVLNLFNSKLVLQNSYVSMLSRVIALAAFEGRVIIVGRGANLVLPPDDGLRVRVVAPRALRIASFAEHEGLDRKVAAARLDEVDASRANFVRRNFHADLNDASNFDLVIDAARFGLGGCVDLIIHGLELRGLVD